MLTTSGANGPWEAETAWTESGGGYLSNFAIPSYQQLSGVINSSNAGSTSYRNGPDIAMEGNYDNSTVINGSFDTGYGGTSYAAPRWAGYIALANQLSVANGQSTVGFLNPAIYGIGVAYDYSADFHDIIAGNNKPKSGANAGFNAVTGFDLVTGWGAPTPSLITSLAGATWTKVANEYQSVFLPKGTTYRYGKGNNYLPYQTTTADWNTPVSNQAMGGDPIYGTVKELDLIGDGAGVQVDNSNFQQQWTKVYNEHDTVSLPTGTTYRFGIGSSYLKPQTTTATFNTQVTDAAMGGDPAQGTVKELDVVGDGTGVTVNGQPFK